MKRVLMNGLMIAALAMTSSACILFQTGSANTTGSIGNREVSVGGTVYAWWDLTSYDVDDNGHLFKQTRDSEDQVLHIQLYGYGFNPREDQRFWSWEDQIKFHYELSQHDQMQFSVNEAGTLNNGARLTYNNEEPPSAGEGPFLSSVSFSAAPVKVNESNDYPDTVKAMGTRNLVTLELKEVEREPGKNIAGSFEIKIEKSDSDDASVATGTLTGDFSASIVHERLAECNNGVGAGFGVDPCADLELDGENP